MPKTDKGSALRRGRPGISDEKRSGMRKQIANVANGLFQSQGYSQVSIRRIATDIGCSPMTLYKYYDSKIDILRTLWANVIGGAFEAVAQQEPSGTTPSDHLQAISSAYIMYWLDNTEHYRLVFMADGVTQPDVSLFVDDPKILARYEVFATAITKAHADELTPERLKLKLDTLLCFLHGIAHNLITLSGYEWSAANDMISVAVDAITQT